MTQYLRSQSGTVHSIERLDHRENHAVAPCGYDGAPVELDDVDDADRCGSCYDVEDEPDEDTDDDA